MNSQLQRVLDLINTATANMNDEQLSWHPPDKWCTAEILEHLSLSYSGTVKGFSKVLRSGAPQARASTFRDRALQALVTGIGYMPTGRKAPAMVVPQGIAPKEAMSSIRANLIAMDKAIHEGEQRFGAKIKVLDHPILGPLTVSQWRKFHLVHTRHHMRQIAARQKNF